MLIWCTPGSLSSRKNTVTELINVWKNCLYFRGSYFSKHERLRLFKQILCCNSFSHMNLCKLFSWRHFSPQTSMGNSYRVQKSCFFILKWFHLPFSGLINELIRDVKRRMFKDKLSLQDNEQVCNVTQVWKLLLSTQINSKNY